MPRAPKRPHPFQMYGGPAHGLTHILIGRAYFRTAFLGTLTTWRGERELDRCDRGWHHIGAYVLAEPLEGEPDIYVWCCNRESKQYEEK